MGEGGGQVLRASLALSLALGRPFEIEGLRGGRLKPGLKRQHLACVKAAQAMSQARVEGDQINSTNLCFSPGSLRGGDYHIEIGSGGSSTLVLQAVLPPLLTASKRSSLTVVGGTHVPMAPIYEYFAHCLLPRLNKMGPRVRSVIEKPGFMLVGGGVIKVEVEPAPALSPLQEVSQGGLTTIGGTILSYNLPREIAEREEKILRTLRCFDLDIEVSHFQDEVGPGNVVYLRAEYGSDLTIASGLAVRGVSAEKVARQALNRLIRFMAAQVPVDEYLADQLVVPSFLAGAGSFLTEKPSLHCRTVLELAAMFTDTQYKISQVTAKAWLVQIGKSI